MPTAARAVVVVMFTMETTTLTSSTPVRVPVLYAVFGGSNRHTLANYAAADLRTRGFDEVRVEAAHVTNSRP